jgi:integrase
MVLSVTNDDGDELYPRNWKKMQLVIRQIISKKQRRPCFTSELMTYLTNSATLKPKMRMLFILCGATGLRIGEALGIRIEKILDGGSRIIIDSKAWQGEEHDFLKTENGEREINTFATLSGSSMFRHRIACPSEPVVNQRQRAGRATEKRISVATKCVAS